MADPATPSRTPTAENQGRRDVPAGTENAQRQPSAVQPETGAATSPASGAPQATTAAGPGSGGQPMKGGQPAPQANQRQPIGTGPTNTQEPHMAGVKSTHEKDKVEELPLAERPATNSVPTQDPPVNVAARVPVGSSRVDLTPSSQSAPAGHPYPGGHLGAPMAGAAPPPETRNPPVRTRGGATATRPSAR